MEMTILQMDMTWFMLQTIWQN